jgi:hypothetical protein
MKGLYIGLSILAILIFLWIAWEGFDKAREQIKDKRGGWKRFIWAIINIIFTLGWIAAAGYVIYFIFEKL